MLFGLFSLWLVEFPFSNVFVFKCTFVGLRCYSVVLIPSLLLLTVSSADFDLYFEEVNFLNYVAVRVSSLQYHCMLQHNMENGELRIGELRTMENCRRLIYQLSTKLWLKFPMTGSSVISSPFGTRLYGTHFDESLCVSCILLVFLLNDSVLLQVHLYNGSVVVVLLLEGLNWCCLLLPWL